MNRYLLAFAHPHLAASYRRESLSCADKARVAAKPHVQTRAQWQSSRALLACHRTDRPAYGYCLSHKHGYSALAGGATKPGVDLEQLRRRDIHAVAAHCFSAQECVALRQSADSLLLFYQLWTLKEALIKLENLHFPKDLRRTGLQDGRLFSPNGAAYRWISLLLDGQWLLSGVWADVGGVPPNLHIHASHPVSVRMLDGNLPAPAIHFHDL